jgi:hypothetical protein
MREGVDSICNAPKFACRKILTVQRESANICYDVMPLGELEMHQCHMIDVLFLLPCRNSGWLLAWQMAPKANLQRRRPVARSRRSHPVLSKIRSVN